MVIMSGKRLKDMEDKIKSIQDEIYLLKDEVKVLKANKLQQEEKANKDNAIKSWLGSGDGNVKRSK